jgi:hypothetical protein
MESIINAALVDKVSSFLNGARRAKFQRSIEILRAAEARGAWDGRESQQVGAGFYQGLVRMRVEVKFDHQALALEPHKHPAEMSLRFGHAYSGPIPQVQHGKGRACSQVSPAVVAAWFQLCSAKVALVKQLDKARPKPVVTAIGLSPKVTKTLTEMQLDIDLPTIKPAEIERYEVQARDKNGELLFKNGEPVMEIHYRVKWAPGTKLNVSRFSNGGGCEACGKHIPSGRFVPVQAECRKKGLIGMWLGCDCARNIFGIKDLGIEQNPAK